MAEDRWDKNPPLGSFIIGWQVLKGSEPRGYRLHEWWRDKDAALYEAQRRQTQAEKNGNPEGYRFGVYLLLPTGFQKVLDAKEATR